MLRLEGEDADLYWERATRRGRAVCGQSSARFGSSHVKLGQYISARADLAIAGLEGLPGGAHHLRRRRAARRPADQEKAFGKVEEVFASFEWAPVASAPIAQVHRAELMHARRGGR